MSEELILQQLAEAQRRADFFGEPVMLVATHGRLWLASFGDELEPEDVCCEVVRKSSQ